MRHGHRAGNACRQAECAKDTASGAVGINPSSKAAQGGSTRLLHLHLHLHLRIPRLQSRLSNPSHGAHWPSSKMQTQQQPCVASPSMSCPPISMPTWSGSSKELRKSSLVLSTHLFGGLSFHRQAAPSQPCCTPCSHWVQSTREQCLVSAPVAN